MKICVFFLIQLLPFIVKVGDWALRWTEGNTAVQIFFVMLLFPVIMNALQYYIIDTFIKKPLSPSHEALAQDDDFDDSLEDGRDGLLPAFDDDDVFGSGDDPLGKDDDEGFESVSQTKADMGPQPPSQHDLPVDIEDIPTVSSAKPSSSSSHGEHEHRSKSPSTKMTAQQKDQDGS